MPSVSPLNSGQTAAGQSSGPMSQLGKDDFLRLLVGRLQHQDPLNPSTDEDFIGQMAQFTMVEQLTNLAGDARRTQTMSLLGRTVTYRNADGTAVTGVVERVELEGGNGTLTVGGQTGIDPASVTEVR